MDDHVARQSPTRTLLILGVGTLGFVLAQTTRRQGVPGAVTIDETR